MTLRTPRPRNSACRSRSQPTATSLAIAPRNPRRPSPSSAIASWGSSWRICRTRPVRTAPGPISTNRRRPARCMAWTWATKSTGALELEGQSTADRLGIVRIRLAVAPVDRHCGRPELAGLEGGRPGRPGLAHPRRVERPRDRQSHGSHACGPQFRQERLQWTFGAGYDALSRSVVVGDDQVRVRVEPCCQLLASQADGRHPAPALQAAHDQAPRRGHGHESRAVEDPCCVQGA